MRLLDSAKTPNIDEISATMRLEETKKNYSLLGKKYSKFNR